MKTKWKTFTRRLRDYLSFILYKPKQKTNKSFLFFDSAVAYIFNITDDNTGDKMEVDADVGIWEAENC